MMSKCDKNWRRSLIKLKKSVCIHGRLSRLNEEPVHSEMGLESLDSDWSRTQVPFTSESRTVELGLDFTRDMQDSDLTWTGQKVDSLHLCVHWRPRRGPTSARVTAQGALGNWERRVIQI